jgi:hypothetical protein
MKRTKPTDKRKPTAEELLKKLRELDDKQIGQVHGGDACWARCGGCGHRCHED